MRETGIHNTAASIATSGTEGNLRSLLQPTGPPGFMRKPFTPGQKPGYRRRIALSLPDCFTGRSPNKFVVRDADTEVMSGGTATSR